MPPVNFVCTRKSTATDSSPPFAVVVVLGISCEGTRPPEIDGLDDNSPFERILNTLSIG